MMKQRQIKLLGCILAAATAALYWPAIWAQFANIDDDEYVVDNPWVTRGFGLAGLKWAFSSSYSANWHPLTWISHQLDYALWGTFAGGHHLTGILLHALNTLLVFLLLRRLTGSLWQSFFVAAFFGWHPLHVESVAWVAERKDVLSTFFFLLTLIAYARYAELKVQKRIEVQSPKSKVQSREPKAQIEVEPHHPSSTVHCPSGVFYWLSLMFFALGLMSKQMLVTVPFVLLLLDYWPLRRFQFESVCSSRRQETEFFGRGEFTASLRRLLQFLKSNLLLEKLPFFMLAFGASAITLVAQRSAGAVRSVQEVPLGLRAVNALSAYGHYLADSVWPVNLCVYYPLPPYLPVVSATFSGILILGLSWLVFRARRGQPWALVGWLWFLGTLVPVIGLVQVGSQSRADRYTYIPSMGLFLMVLWSAGSLVKDRRMLTRLGCITVLASLLGCLGLTRHQLRYWHDGISLCSRAIAVTTNNAFAHNSLAAALADQGRSAEAILQYREALRINPNYTWARSNLGNELAAAGQLDEAAFQLSEALKGDPRSEILHNNLGAILAQQHKLDSAVEHFERAIQLNPEYPKAYLNYAVALQNQGQAGRAFTNYQRGLELYPTWPQALDKLAFLLATCPMPEYHDPQRAVSLAERANELTLRVAPNYLDTLAVAYAAAGEFPKAASTAEKAQAQALRKGDQAMADRLAHDLEWYRCSRSPELDWTKPGAGPMPIEGRCERASTH